MPSWRTMTRSASLPWMAKRSRWRRRASRASGSVTSAAEEVVWARTEAASWIHSSSGSSSCWNCWLMLSRSAGERSAARHQVVDEEAVAAVRGHAPGRSVRVVDVAGGLERRHRVADCRRADLEVVLLDERVRANRASGVDVLRDDDLENRLLSRVELVHGAASSPPSTLPSPSASSIARLPRTSQRGRGATRGDTSDAETSRQWPDAAKPGLETSYPEPGETEGIQRGEQGGSSDESRHSGGVTGRSLGMRQREAEGAARSDLALDPDPVRHRLDQPLCDV